MQGFINFAYFEFFLLWLMLFVPNPFSLKVEVCIQPLKRSAWSSTIPGKTRLCLVAEHFEGVMKYGKRITLHFLALLRIQYRAPVLFLDSRLVTICIYFLLVTMFFFKFSVQNEIEKVRTMYKTFTVCKFFFPSSNCFFFRVSSIGLMTYKII